MSLTTNYLYYTVTLVIALLLLCCAPAFAQTATPQEKPLSQWVTPMPKPLTERLPLMSTRSDADEFSIGHILQRSAPFATNHTPIGHHYYVDNLFAIDESDNPFALRRSNQKFTIRVGKQNQTPTLWENLNDLFSPQDKKNIPSGAPHWLLFFLFGGLAVLALTMSLFRQDVFKIFAAFVNSTAAGQLYRDQKNDLFTPVGISTLLLFCLSVGSFVFLAVPHLAANNEIPTWNNFSTFGLTVSGLAAMYLLKALQVKTIGLIFPFRQEMDFYNFLISNHNKVLGIAFLPLVFVLAYTEGAAENFALYTGLALLGGMYLYRGFRAVATCSDWIFLYKFHFFVYLCTAEIAPALILIKLLSA